MVAVLTRPSIEEQASSGEVPLEQLELRIAQRAASIAAATCVWLLQIAEYDRRGGWNSWGCRSCAHWLNWKCGVSMRTAREHVAVANALVDLPVTLEAFGAGRISYSKARAICRVATPEGEAELVRLATVMTASQLERTCSGYASAKDPEHEIDLARRVFADRRVVRTNNFDGSHTIKIVVPTDMAELVMAAVNRQLDADIADLTDKGGSRRDVIDHRGGLAAMRADALVEALTDPGCVVTESQSGSAEPSQPEAQPSESRQSGSRPASCDLTVIASPGVLSADFPDLFETSMVNRYRAAPPVVQRFACESSMSEMTIDPNGDVLDIGRASRVVPTKMRKALEHRDQHSCQFPGCDATQHLHAHHIVWWRNGGKTKLDNLVLLCNFHHHSVHEGGWNVLNWDGAVTFTRPDGSAAPPTQLPAQPFPLPSPQAQLECHADETRPNYSYITSTLIHNEQLAKKRQAAA